MPQSSLERRALVSRVYYCLYCHLSVPGRSVIEWEQSKLPTRVLQNDDVRDVFRTY